MKAEGLLPGMPDFLFAMEEGRTAWLEFKTSIGALSPYQQGIKHKLEQLGHPWALARSAEEAFEYCAGLGVLK